MQPIFYCICRGARNLPGYRISHIMKVIPTTMDKISDIYNREVAPLFMEEGMYDIHVLMIDRPADVSFLPALAKYEKEGKL